MGAGAGKCARKMSVFNLLVPKNVPYSILTPDRECTEVNFISDVRDTLTGFLESSAAAGKSFILILYFFLLKNVGNILFMQLS